MKSVDKSNGKVDLWKQFVGFDWPCFGRTADACGKVRAALRCLSACRRVKREAGAGTSVPYA